MRAEILATGDEILTGALIDSNSAYLAEQLELLGVEVVRHHTVGDNIRELVAMLAEVGRRADLAVVTGGLGPTTDDLTAQAAAEAAGVSLVLDNKALADIEQFFADRKREMTPSNRKQAMIPQGAFILRNQIGTAPGFTLKIGRCWFYFMPGVPGEMRKMFQGQVLAHIREAFDKELHPAVVRTITTFGLPESEVGERVAGVESLFKGIKLGLRARFPEIQVKLYGRSGRRPQGQDNLEEAARWVCHRLGHNLVSDQGHCLPEVVGQLLRQNRSTVAVAESCTGGLIAHLLTNVAGSSDYLLGAVVAYANQVKTGVLKVDPRAIADRGAVSREVVEQMAKGVCNLTGADYGVATSGIAGPTGGSPEKPVGTVCIGLATPEGIFSRRYRLFFGSREAHKTIFAAVALNRLRLSLSGGKEDSKP